MKIFVSNLSSTATEMELKLMFDEFGIVDSTTILKDKFSFRTMRFGFVDMPNDFEALKAIENLNGRAVNGRKLTVHKSHIKSNDKKTSKLHSNNLEDKSILLEKIYEN